MNLMMNLTKVNLMFLIKVKATFQFFMDLIIYAMF